MGGKGVVTVFRGGGFLLFKKKIPALGGEKRLCLLSGGGLPFIGHLTQKKKVGLGTISLLPAGGRKEGHKQISNSSNIEGGGLLLFLYRRKKEMNELLLWKRGGRGSQITISRKNKKIFRILKERFSFFLSAM